MPETLTLHAKRVIRAERQRVYEAWTNPELLPKWFGCSQNNETATVTTDVRVGGSYRIATSGDCKGVVFGIYTEIIPNERLCFTWKWSDDPSSETVVTVEFRDVTDGTEVTLNHERFESQDACGQHEQGWRECLDNLDRYLRKERQEKR